MVLFFFFFKQKTAYEMCGRDWSSDVCSSDLMAVDDDGNQDLFMVDCGIESLQNVYLNFPSTKTLNLHSNFIPR